MQQILIAPHFSCVLSPKTMYLFVRTSKNAAGFLLLEVIMFIWFVRRQRST